MTGMWRRRACTVPRNARSLRHRVFTAALSAIAIAGLVTPAAVLGASGGSRVRLEYPLQFEGDIDCGTFHDVFTDYYDVQEVDEFDAHGNLVVITYKAFHRSDDRNSVTGYTLHERGRFNEVDDLSRRNVHAHRRPAEDHRSRQRPRPAGQRSIRGQLGGWLGLVLRRQPQAQPVPPR